MYRDQTGIVDGGDTLDDGLAFLFHPLFRDIGSGSGRVEGIQDTDRDILMINRIDRRRIDYFRPEVTQLHRLRESKPVDYVGGADHTGIGGHATIPVRPDLQGVSV